MISSITRTGKGRRNLDCIKDAHAARRETFFSAAVKFQKLAGVWLISVCTNSQVFKAFGTKLLCCTRVGNSGLRLSFLSRNAC